MYLGSVVLIVTCLHISAHAPLSREFGVFQRGVSVNHCPTVEHRGRLKSSRSLGSRAE